MDSGCSGEFIEGGSMKVMMITVKMIMMMIIIILMRRIKFLRNGEDMKGSRMIKQSKARNGESKMVEAAYLLPSASAEQDWR